MLYNSGNLPIAKPKEIIVKYVPHKEDDTIIVRSYFT
jgi:hypothetical protein